MDEPTVERRAGRKLLDRSLVVVVIPEELQLALDPGTCGPIDLVHEDAAVLVIDKPAGLVVHPSGRHLTDTLIQRLHADHLRRIEAGTLGDVATDPLAPGPMPPKLCHRLDRETSGLVLCARDPRSHAALVLDFEERRIDKRYLAVVHGVPDEPRGDVHLELGPSLVSEVRLKVAVQADGWPSHTSYELLDSGRLPDGRPCSLVACVPHTGRQHQIRVHLAAIGHPLVGDKLYDDEGIFLRAANDELTGADHQSLVLPRHALHNELLGFTHPTTGAKVEVRAELPADMAALLG
ncbi:MAG: RluA family pseudouridine synthase [Planctomycetota bacterium]|nr:RluA family pseudouridine synthase [Planctomycetota bacterium]